MSDEGGPALTVDEFVDYCRTQAGLLSGSVETMREEADALLDEIDEGAAEVRMRLAAGSDGTERARTPAAPDAPDGGPTDAAAIEELESDLEAKQTLVAAKGARIDAFRSLADDYIDLAESLRSDADDGRAALTRVVRFEADRDAPAYFEDRLTVCEAVASRASDPE